MSDQIYKIHTLIVSPDGQPTGEGEVRDYRFVPRIGEHVLFTRAEGDGADVYEVIEVRHTPAGEYKIHVMSRGTHADRTVVESGRI
jgi:hypothetical protein